MINLTTRQWKLYTFIKESSESGIIVNYDDILKEDEFKELYIHSIKRTVKKRAIRLDVEIINQHQTIIQKPIINSGTGYYIPESVQIYKVWSDKKWKQLKKMIKELADKDKKIAYDSQYKIIYDENSSAKNYVEATIKNAKN